MSKSDFFSADRSLEIHVELDRLHEVSLGQVELQRELLQTLIEVIQVNLDTIQYALETRDCVTLARCAHQIKGASANVGVPSVQAIAAELECRAIAQNLSDTADLLAALKNQELGLYVFIANHLSE